MFLWFKVKRSFWEVRLDGRCPVPPYDLVHILTYSNSSFPSCPWLMAKEGHRTYAHSLYMLPMNVSSKRSSFLCWKRHLKILNSKRPREFQQCGSIHILKTFLFQLCIVLLKSCSTSHWSCFSDMIFSHFLKFLEILILQIPFQSWFPVYIFR